MFLQVFRVERDYSTKFRELEFDGDDDDLGALWAHLRHGTLMSDSWQPPPAYVTNAACPPPDAYVLPWLKGFGFSQRAIELVGEDLNLAGELLPLSVSGEPVWFLNIITIPDCLDADTSTFHLSGLPISYSFIRHRLPDGSLFRIPQTAGGEMLCLHEDGNPSRDFMARWMNAGLIGTQFLPVWNSRDGGLPPSGPFQRFA